MTAPLIEIIYCSRETAPGIEPVDPKIVAILNTARRRNEPLGITGALIFQASCFAQLLEGPSEAVDQLFEHIRADPRHHDVVVLSRRAIADRLFPDWAMGFAPTQDGQAPEAFLARAMASGDAASANGVRVMLQQSTADNGVWGTYVPVDADAPI